MKQSVYVDNNATTAVAPEVTEAMLPFFYEQWGNPSSMHTFGGGVKKHIDEAREKVAALIGAEHPNEIIFTSCGSESDNMAVRGAVDAMGGHPHLITTRVEHAAVLGPCHYLEDKGFRLSTLEVDDAGNLDMEQVREKSMSGKATVASIMWANNETGVIFPVPEIGNLIKEGGGIFHTDGVQIVGKLPISVKDIPVDLLSISGHKLHAPKGIGVLYAQRGTKITPHIMGGHQERGRRAGTENVPYIVGLGKACELALQRMEHDAEHERKLRDRLEAGILASCKGARVNGGGSERLPNTTNISFEYVEGEAILLMLDDVGICASTGSACASGSLEPSHVLRAMDVPRSMLHGSIRFSLSNYNTGEDIDYVLEQIPRIIARLRELSPFAND
ncbi:cysteine desulfurase NifS [Pontiella sulfatireligans]|uniref:Cysteine desulfurase n=1 Tax=Pontiella sulfatireligans TaxID=2750658 RepID=A0A6C2UFY7_9BACT|nr:cysteine desulfurase NifS [Pontiella sulfatireligans]VGO18437.1 Cysteine desulfurase NifS [Pontiella sulfatireligans]